MAADADNDGEEEGGVEEADEREVRRTLCLCLCRVGVWSRERSVKCNKSAMSTVPAWRLSMASNTRRSSRSAPGGKFAYREKLFVHPRVRGRSARSSGLKGGVACGGSEASEVGVARRTSGACAERSGAKDSEQKDRVERVCGGEREGREAEDSEQKD